MAGIDWTKLWSGTNNGEILKGTDLGNIQDDLANVLTSDDIGVLVQSFASRNYVCYEGDALTYDNDLLYVS